MQKKFKISEEKPPFMSIHQKKKGYEKDDQNTICLPWQDLLVMVKCL